MSLVDIMQAFDLTHGDLNSLSVNEAYAIYKRKKDLTKDEKRKEYLDRMFEAICKVKKWQTKK